VRTYELDNLI